jgi:serine O-acetyltransferase
MAARAPGVATICKRHPTLGDHVVVGSGAKVLGNIRIGNNVRVGAGSVIIRSVPDNSTVVGVPGRIVRCRDVGNVLEHGRLPDPEGEAMDGLARRVTELEGMLNQLISQQEWEHSYSRG